MRLVVVSAAFLSMLALGTGCAVRDNNPHLEPIWWPNGLVRASSLQTAGGRVEVHPTPPNEWLPPFNPDGSLKMP
jgi:hypothetical protein